LGTRDEHRHEGRRCAGGVFEQLEQALNLRVVTLGSDAVEAVDLTADYLVPYAENFGMLLFVAAEFVDADDGAMAVVDGHLVAVRGFLDLALLVSHLNGPQRTADVLDTVEVPRGFLLDAVGQLLDVVGAAEGVDDVSDA